MRDDLPDATKKPCNDCPWRRASVRGWLGPHDAETWLLAAHGDGPIACHQTIVTVDDKGEGDWSDDQIRQCAGEAIFRSNICKSPRDRAVITLPSDHKLVFSWDNEFKDHHER